MEETGGAESGKEDGVVKEDKGSEAAGREEQGGRAAEWEEAGTTRGGAFIADSPALGVGREGGTKACGLTGASPGCEYVLRVCTQTTGRVNTGEAATLATGSVPVGRADNAASDAGELDGFMTKECCCGSDGGCCCCGCCCGKGRVPMTGGDVWLSFLTICCMASGGSAMRMTGGCGLAAAPGPARTLVLPPPEVNRI